MKNAKLFEKHLSDLENIKLSRKRAVIREPECIGCAKCIEACPVDAILGGAKQLHTVIEFDCTGCELCVAPCPVDCIDIIIASENDSSDYRQQKLAHFKNKYARHKDQQNKIQHQTKIHQRDNTPQTTEAKQAYIQAALARVKEQKEQKEQKKTKRLLKNY